LLVGCCVVVRHLLSLLHTIMRPTDTTLSDCYLL
jgi:hypothetical protein